MRSGGGSKKNNSENFFRNFFPSPIITIETEINSGGSEISESVVIDTVKDEIQTVLLPYYPLPSLPSVLSSDCRYKCRMDGGGGCKKNSENFSSPLELGTLGKFCDVPSDR